MLKAIIEKYRRYERENKQYIEDHPEAPGISYVEGYARAIHDILAEIEETAKNGDYIGRAGRILNTDFFGIRDSMDGEAAPEDMTAAISEDLQDLEKCQYIIDYLLNIIEEERA